MTALAPRSGARNLARGTRFLRTPGNNTQSTSALMSQHASGLRKCPNSRGGHRLPTILEFVILGGHRPPLQLISRHRRHIVCSPLAEPEFERSSSDEPVKNIWTAH